MVDRSASPNRPNSETDQASENKVVRVFLNDREEGTFICPACDNGVIKDLGNFIQYKSAIRIKCKCKCGHMYHALVERRKYFRKPVNLIGTFFYKGDKKIPKKGIIRVLDISKSGLQFSVNCANSFKIGDRLIVEFKLDDKERSFIREKGIVRGIRSHIVGIEFDDTDHCGELGFYLLQ